jgi:hypothetical protein
MSERQTEVMSEAGWPDRLLIDQIAEKWSVLILASLWAVRSITRFRRLTDGRSSTFLKSRERKLATTSAPSRTSVSVAKLYASVRYC